MIELLTIILDLFKHITRIFIWHNDVKETFNNISFNKIKKNLKKTIRYYLEDLYADRIDICLFKEGRISQVFELTRQGVSGVRKYLLNLSPEKVFEYINIIKNNELIIYHDIQKDCDKDIIKNDLDSRNVKSLYLIGIFNNDNILIGDISVVYNTNKRLSKEQIKHNAKKIYIFVGAIKEILGV